MQKLLLSKQDAGVSDKDPQKIELEEKIKEYIHRLKHIQIKEEFIINSNRHKKKVVGR